MSPITILLLASTFQSDAVTRQFVYRADKPLTSVAIAGTFNGWNKGATLLSEDPDQRTWHVNLTLKPGKILYKFVLNDNDWVTDPANPKTDDDGNGHTNSLLLILPSDYARPAAKGDGFVTESALRHRDGIPDVNVDRGNLTLSLRARPNDVERVLVRSGSRSYPTVEHPIDDLYTRYSATIPWTGNRNLRYSFELDDGPKHYRFGPKGLTDPMASRDNEYSLGAGYKPFTPPSWLEGTVIYQIFPDRFANGDKSNDPKNVVPWDAKPTYSNRFGGDVAGIRQHFGYLEGLGINAVYFNPVFESPSNHRYETTDWLKIDPSFGTNQEFGDLTRQMASKGIRTILDGVFNHSATNFFAFQDILANQKGSKYLGWYTIKQFPVRVQQNPPYVAWFNYPSMPKLNVLNPATESYLLGVLDYWDKRAEIAGWRLDTGAEVSSDYWRAFRRHLKSLNPNYWIVGEEWGDATPWLRGDQWDSVMNYPFRAAILRFLGKSGDAKPSEFMKGLMANYSSYAPQVSRNLMNLLGSHDTPRILTECGGDRQLAKLAAIIQFTWVGTPSVYYGDELGMEGERDPDNRRGMEWGLANSQNDMLSLYRKLISLRRSHKVLQSGDPVLLRASDRDGVAAYARVLGEDAAVVAINRSAMPKAVAISLSGLSEHSDFVNALDGAPAPVSRHMVSLTIPARGAAILVRSHAISSSSYGSPVARLVARPSNHALHGSKELS